MISFTSVLFSSRFHCPTKNANFICKWKIRNIFANFNMNSIDIKNLRMIVNRAEMLNFLVNTMTLSQLILAC